jgi:hypothetical protein
MKVSCFLNILEQIARDECWTGAPVSKKTVLGRNFVPGSELKSYIGRERTRLRRRTLVRARYERAYAGTISVTRHGLMSITETSMPRNGNCAKNNRAYSKTSVKNDKIKTPKIFFLRQAVSVRL